MGGEQFQYQDQTGQGQAGTTGDIDSSQYWRPPGVSMTYHAMRGEQMLAQSDAGQMAPAANDGAMLAERGRGRFLFFGKNQDGRSDTTPPAAMPQEQPRQGVLRRPALFGGAAQARNAAAHPLTKFEFNGKDETGLVKEISLPANFAEVKQDPDFINPLVKREFETSDHSRVTIYEGMELSADDQKRLAAILAKTGRIDPVRDGQRYDDACAMIVSGNASFINNPQLSVSKFGDRNVIVVQDSDPRQKLTSYSMFMPSDRGQFLYGVGFDGKTAEFTQVKKGFDTMKWRPTPDVVAPPGPKN